VTNKENQFKKKRKKKFVEERKHNLTRPSDKYTTGLWTADQVRIKLTDSTEQCCVSVETHKLLAQER
jgi:hypothetical protein